MKRILLGIVLIFTGLVAQSQAIRSDVAILDSVAHISSYFGGSKYIHVKDSVLGGAFYLYQGVLPVDGTTIIAGANSSKWKRMYGSYDRRYLSSVGGINNFTVTDSSLLIYLQNNLKLGTKFNQFVLTNTPYVNIPSIYQAKGGSHDGNFNPSQLLLVRKFNEALGDTLVQMGYGGATTAYSEYRMDSGSTRFRYDNKYIVLPNYGFYSDGRFYAPRDSVEVRTNGNGQSGSGAVQAMSIGDTWGYNIYVNSTQYAPYPLAANITTYDFMRNDSRGRKRQITGNGVAGYVADWKNYQYGSVSPSTNEDNSYINKVVDFYSMGGRNDDINAGSTKAKIMLVSKVDSAIGFYSRQKYHPFNEVWNGYGFVQDGTEDYNHFQGRVKIGASRPNRNSGGIAQNLLVEGSTRSDSIFNRYTKFDSTGRIVFTEKNDPSLNGAYLIQLNQTLDSNANQNSVAGGLRSYRNWLDAKNILIPEPTVDARNYYRIGAGRTSTLQNCVGCSFSEYFGYKQIILGAGSTINYSSVEPRIYWARNEVNGLSSGSKGKASGLNLTGYANLFVMGPNVDSVGTLYGYKEDGIIGNSVTDIAAKYSFYDASVWQSNVRTQYGFYQVDNKIKNRFAGLTEFGSNIVYLSKDSIPYTASNGARQMLTVDTTTGIQYRMPIPAGGLSGLTTNRVLFAGSSTTAIDDAELTYNSTTNELTVDKLKLATTSTTVAPLNIGGFGTIPTSPSVGDVVFDASDSSIKVRSGSNWIPYYYGKDVVAGTNITIARGSGWNVPDTINASGGGGVTDGDKGDITVTGTGATWTIDNQAVTYAKIQNVTDARLLGRSAGSAGSAQEITVSSDMSLAAGVLGVGSNVPLKNGTNTFTGANTFNTNDVTFSGINAVITGGAANLKYTDQNDARNLLVYLNTRKFTFLAQQTSFSSHIPLYFDLSAPVDAMNLHSTGALRLNTVSTATDVASRKLYVNGSVGLNKDSLPTVTTIGTENFALVDNSTGQVKKVTAANVATSLGLNSSGTWTPTYTYTTNTSATSSGHFRYQQIGDQIYIHGDIVFNPTSTGVAQVDITLPFANGITNSYDVSGTGVAFDKAAEPVEIFYNNSGGTIAFKTTVAATGTRTYKFTAIMHYQAP